MKSWNDWNIIYNIIYYDSQYNIFTIVIKGEFVTCSSYGTKLLFTRECQTENCNRVPLVCMIKVYLTIIVI